VSTIQDVTYQARRKIMEIMTPEALEEFSVIHYGANDIHPRYLVFWICVQSDRERDRLRADTALMERLRHTLLEVDYPPEGRDEVAIGFESQETVDRVSDGNWYYHWK
jgi:hypothetical protein